MRIIEIKVTKDLTDARLDTLITTQLESMSRTYITGLIRDGFVLVNNEKKRAKYKPQIDDVINISIPDVSFTKLIAEDLNLDILFEDQDVAVVNKPSGMVVHPSAGHGRGTLVNGIMYAIKDLSGINGKIRPGIVHRIDKDTSGVLMIAKNDQAHESLSKQLKAKTIKREYIALVHGVINHNLGKIEAPIGRGAVDRMRYEVVYNGKDAITHFEVLKRFANKTLVKCQLETGRTHQIRVHMLYIGHPLVGDPIYGLRKTKRSDFGQFLHAKLIGFYHPKTNELMIFESDLPKEFTDYLKEIE